MSQNDNHAFVQILRAEIDEMGLKYMFDSDRGIAIILIGVQNLWNGESIRLSLDVSDTNVNAIAAFPVKADLSDKQVKQDIAEFLLRTNYPLRYGDFHLDYRDGGITFEMTVPVDEENPTPLGVRECLTLPIVMCFRYDKGILAVLNSVMSPEDALKMCEEDEDDDGCVEKNATEQNRGKHYDPL